MTELSIVIPVKNESNNIKPLIQEIIEELNHLNYEVIFVDDCSNDGTLAEILKNKRPYINTIRLDKHMGQSFALSKGIELSKGTFIAVIDGDLQNHPRDINTLLSILKTSGASLVQGYRKKRYDGISKNIPSKVANLLIRKLFKSSINDVGCSLKVGKKELFLSLPYFDGFHRYIPLLAELEGYKIYQEEVTHRKRTRGKSKYGLMRIFKVLAQLIKIKKKYKTSLKKS